MKVKDKYGSVLFLQQARNGKIQIVFGNSHFVLSREDSEKFSLYEMEDFDMELWKKAYN